ncbi:MAG: hypothetical protein WC554_11700 [Clostridia bacterium]|jgi:hypothetical protein
MVERDGAIVGGPTLSRVEAAQTALAVGGAPAWRDFDWDGELDEDESAALADVITSARQIAEEGWDADSAEDVVSGSGVRDAAAALHPQGGCALGFGDWIEAVVAEVALRVRAAS